ncbi:MaoC family dehydratase [Thaumasiovibrio subtropicus]|uniref:MaoC family dehydratase n=1 Tax=Thaumasiovibrio subtropicus TaxID=1891207 RepID=UPI000B351817|nr:MaoC/PaaZ C-terminal domain-containing protein [Thaumasiovibrio subtropicus]
MTSAFLQLDNPVIPSYGRLLWRALWKRSHGGVLPPILLEKRHFQFKSTDLVDYCDYFGFSHEEVPIPYLFVATQPMQLYLFTHPEMPIQPLGMVHVGVSFEKRTKLLADTPYVFTLQLGEQQQTERGCVFELVGVFSSPTSGEVARYRSRYLVKGKQKAQGKVTTSKTPTDLSVYSSVIQDASSWTFDVSRSRRYARLSGDYNPIHLHTAFARLFGFRHPIAHGMELVGALCANVTQSAQCTELHVEFKRPLLLPQQMAFATADDHIALLNDANKPCVEMKWFPYSGAAS